MAQEFAEGGAAQAADGGEIFALSAGAGLEVAAENGRDADEAPAVGGKHVDADFFDAADRAVFGDEGVDEALEVVAGFGGKDDELGELVVAGGRGGLLAFGHGLEIRCGLGFEL